MMQIGNNKRVGIQRFLIEHNTMNYDIFTVCELMVTTQRPIVGGVEFGDLHADKIVFTAIGGTIEIIFIDESGGDRRRVEALDSAKT